MEGTMWITGRSSPAVLSHQTIDAYLRRFHHWPQNIDQCPYKNVYAILMNKSQNYVLHKERLEEEVIPMSYFPAVLGNLFPRLILGSLQRLCLESPVPGRTEIYFVQSVMTVTLYGQKKKIEVCPKSEN